MVAGGQSSVRLAICIYPSDLNFPDTFPDIYPDFQIHMVAGGQSSVRVAICIYPSDLNFPDTFVQITGGTDCLGGDMVHNNPVSTY